ncbi:uncharacterized protein PHALS_07009 [Plasmopara halstedii]|uniref:Uncharacterized protein n=1 Tax=Plasmopara halstedii TaxID=4781 RepID=A0A0P1B426_PLAHL|nr:uncharacterized protein PHALS_07009 [Plasmopara halstedii]CEG49237.1 hypothetical protein PHALS_07009 [Plasmopara halstedii]|eukprot:XP_024585606.1 hypothetical protein PHALS_07009 [Plasmopara halstedii]
MCKFGAADASIASYDILLPALVLCRTIEENLMNQLQSWGSPNITETIDEKEFKRKYRILAHRILWSITTALHELVDKISFKEKAKSLYDCGT